MNRFMSVQVKANNKDDVIKAVKKYKNKKGKGKNIIGKLEEGIVDYFLPKKYGYIIKQKDMDYITILSDDINREFNKFISEELNTISIRTDFNEFKYYELEAYENGVEKAYIKRDEKIDIDNEEIEKFVTLLGNFEIKEKLIEALEFEDIFQSYGKVEKVLNMNLFMTMKDLETENTDKYESDTISYYAINKKDK